MCSKGVVKQPEIDVIFVFQLPTIKEVDYHSLVDYETHLPAFPAVFTFKDNCICKRKQWGQEMRKLFSVCCSSSGNL